MSDEAIEKDKYEHLNYEDRAIQGKGGKGRSKKEAEMNTNRPDIGGHTRKVATNLMNNHHNEVHQKHPPTKEKAVVKPAPEEATDNKSGEGLED